MKCLITWLLLCLAAGSVWSAKFIVNSAADSHDLMPGDGYARDHIDPDSARCTLRAAIEEAGALPGSDTVLVPLGVSPISLHLGTLVLNDNKTVILGFDGSPIIDAINNPTNYATFALESDSNQIRGLQIRRSRGDAVFITGAYNYLGGPVSGMGLTLIGNGLDNETAGAIRISGVAAVGNAVLGCSIGIHADGLTTDGNRHGIIIEQNASNNLIGTPDGSGRNLISGNRGYGVLIESGANDNQVAGNFIGPDTTGGFGPGNMLGGVLIKTRAKRNLIGGNDLTEGNLISGNQGHGVELAGSEVFENIVNGNWIGTDVQGLYRLGNLGDGLKLSDGAHDNILGGPDAEAGNLISGNYGNGICLSGEGVANNIITANWIGISRSGHGWLGNGWTSGSGILIDSGAHHNTIGDGTESGRNVISGNQTFGVHIDGTGTDNNLLTGNYIGLNYTGSSSVGNDAGVVISNGAQYNLVGGRLKSDGNVISSNRGDDFPFGAGVLIYGAETNFNTVSANLIGLDATGTKPRPNATAGVILGAGAQRNLIGGEVITDGNIISGNGIGEPIDGVAPGIHIFGATTNFNRIVGNLIGLDITTHEYISNNGHGIGIYSGASFNLIGGQSFREGNQIQGNAGAGIFISGRDTKSNLIRYNIMDENDGPGIEIRDSAQENIQAPTVTHVGILNISGRRRVVGENARPGSRLDFYDVYESDLSGAGEGVIYQGSGWANVNGRFDFYLDHGSAVPILMTVIATDSSNNSSEFGINRHSDDYTAAEESETTLPFEFSLSQNYPNPFNPATSIQFALPVGGMTTLEIINTLGQTVRTLIDTRLPSGHHITVWDGLNASGHQVASGVYLYRLRYADRVESRKMLLLK